MSESALSRFETGAQELRLRALRALADYYGCSIDALLQPLDWEGAGLVVRSPVYQPASDTNPAALLELRGLGKELWQDEDPDEYVRRLREGWN